VKKLRVLIPQGCRSDFGLSNPIIKRMKKKSFFELEILKLIPSNFLESYKITEEKIVSFKPDLIFITGDRIEQMASSCASFMNNIFICHYFAGVLTDPLTNLDDIFRHNISLMSEIQLVESTKCWENVLELFYAVNKRSNCYIVGATHLEDLEIDISLVPKHSYDLVLYNPTTLYKEDIVNIGRKRFYKNTIWIGPNPDPSFFDIKKASETRSFWCTPKGFKPNPILFKYYENLPRPQFLGLLKWCSRFITNSSSAIYEAPYFLKKDQIVMIGDRNKKRTPFVYKKTDKLASEKIVDVLKKWWINGFKMKEINEICKDCNHLEKIEAIEGISPLCGFALSLAHWQDAKKWPRNDFKSCPIKDLNYKEANDYYFGVF